ncbi:hypothetical protein ABPG72_011140 [Tetrahymena utriculariae]
MYNRMYINSLFSISKNSKKNSLFKSTQIRQEGETNKATISSEEYQCRDNYNTTFYIFINYSTILTKSAEREGVERIHAIVLMAALNCYYIFTELNCMQYL